MSNDGPRRTKEKHSRSKPAPSSRSTRSSSPCPFSATARAQERDAPKLEVGVQYSSLSVDLPGFGGTEHAVGFGEALNPVLVQAGGPPVFRFERERKTHFSMDVGGVLEFYPSRRLLTRFDVGDTLIRCPSRDNPSTFTTTPPPPRLPAELRHNLQVTAGIEFRF